MTPRQIIAEFLADFGLQGTIDIAEDLIDTLHGHGMEIIRTWAGPPSKCDNQNPHPPHYDESFNGTCQGV